MSRRAAWWLATVPFAVLAAIAHWLFWYQPRLRPAAPGDDLPSRLFVASDYDHAVWSAHPHQNLPTLSELTGLDGPALAAVLRLAGLDVPTLRGVRLPPASSLAVAVADTDGTAGRWTAAARLHPLAAAFGRLAGVVAGNPWLGGGTVSWQAGEAAAAEVTIAWRGSTWMATTAGAAELERLASASPAGPWPTAVAWFRQNPSPRSSSHLAAGTVGLFARAGVVELTTGPPALAAHRSVEHEPGRLLRGRRVLDATGAWLLLVQRGRPAEASPDQAMMLLSLPPGTDDSELPRAAVLRNSLAAGRAGQGWKLPGESLLELAGHDLPHDAAVGWQLLATDDDALASARAAAQPLRALAEERLPKWGLWLDAQSAAAEIDRLVRGQEHSPFLSRADRRRWRDAATVLRAMARRPAQVEGYVDGEEIVLRWRATSP